MAVTRKQLSYRDANQVLQGSAVQEDDTIMTSGYLAGKVGRKITFTNATTTVSDDTQVITFSEDGVSLYEYTLIYADSTQQTLLSAERTA